jgi:cytochrome c peroxidase
MKIVLKIFSLFVITYFIYSFIQKNNKTYLEIQTDLISNIDVCIANTSSFISLLNSNEEVDYIEEYKKVRFSYKNIETYIVFRYPIIDKTINGGPVPSITRDIVVLHKDDPTGLQVIEELIVENEIDKDKVLNNLYVIQKNLQTVKSAFQNLPLLNWEILDANHMAITRMISLSLSGFDSPSLVLSIPDSEIVVSQIYRDLQTLKEFSTKDFNWEELDALFQSTIIFLEKNSNFEELNRYALYRNFLIPIQKKIKLLHLDTGYEFYDEVTSIKRSIGRGGHLFALDYLDPFYSMKGNNISHNQKQIDLGKTLFYDPILSNDNTMSCASCHNPLKSFTDGVDKSLSNNKLTKGKRNSPTLINSCFQNNFFWDLRSSDMNDQIMNVILSKDEFNTSPDEIVYKLKKSKGYQKMFKDAYFAHDTPITIGNIKSSLELYVRSLVCLNSKFDKNIRGELNNLTQLEIDGANLFLGKASCATCHFAPNFNGFVPPHFQETEGEILGVLDKPNSTKLDSDLGVYERFKKSYPEAIYIKGMFKTPTIRNIELTGPYMHNGKYTSLEEVVDFYNHGGAMGKKINIPQQTLSSDSLNLTKYEKKAIISFMKTLTDTTGSIVQPFVLPKFEDENLDNRKWGGTY